MKLLNEEPNSLETMTDQELAVLKVFCPDCQENEITGLDMKNQKVCRSCNQRKTIAKIHNIEYIPWIKLSKEERDRLTKEREKTRAREEKKKVDKIKTKSSNRERVYTDEMIQKLKLWSNEKLYTSTELRQKLEQEYPEVNITTGNFQNVLSRQNITIRKINRGQKNKPDRTIQSVPIINEIEPEKKFTNYYEKAEKEVQSILDSKFNEMNCLDNITYTVDDYLQAFSIIANLVDNKDEIFNKRELQYKILNWYQDDIIHEIENTDIEEGNPYLQTKLKVLRNKRRYYEDDRNLIIVLSDSLEKLKSNLDLNTIDECITKIERFRDTEPIYRPRVDNTLLDKYDWAQPLEDSKDLVPYTISNNCNHIDIRLVVKDPAIEKTKSKNEIPWWSYQAYISGCGAGTFKKWTRVFATNSQSRAEELGNQAIQEYINEKYKGAMISNRSVHRINNL